MRVAETGVGHESLSIIFRSAQILLSVRDLTSLSHSDILRLSTPGERQAVAFLLRNHV